MNVSFILEVADAIEKQLVKDLGFSMLDFFSDENVDLSGHGCKTTACIAGWAVAVGSRIGSMSYVRTDAWHIYQKARDLLGLDRAQAELLFCAFPTDDTQEHAVRVLRHLACTGQVDWSIE